MELRLDWFFVMKIDSVLTLLTSLINGEPLNVLINVKKKQKLLKLGRSLRTFTVKGKDIVIQENLT